MVCIFLNHRFPFCVKDLSGQEDLRGHNWKVKKCKKPALLWLKRGPNPALHQRGPALHCLPHPPLPQAPLSEEAEGCIQTHPAVVPSLRSSIPSSQAMSVCVCPLPGLRLHLFQPPAREFGSHPLCSFGEDLTCTYSWQDWAEA